MRTLPIQIPMEAIEAFCRKYELRRLALFGSVLRDDFTPESDVDVLVELDPDTRMGLIGFAGMEIELSEILGRKVDLKTLEFLSPYFVEEVRREALPLYVAA